MFFFETQCIALCRKKALRHSVLKGSHKYHQGMMPTYVRYGQLGIAAETELKIERTFANTN